MRRLSLDFYKRENTLEIARELLGKVIVVPDEKGNRVSGLIVETEAYLGSEDRAAHSFNNRRTKRTDVMFWEGGVAYIFLIYGMYFQFNVVTASEGIPNAILVRAVQPLEGIEIIRRRRKGQPDKNLTSGPGKLSIALAINQSFNGEKLDGNRIWIEEPEETANFEIASGARIGIDYAEEWKDKEFRFWIKGNANVSKQ